ncbi:hypothetical protein GH714_032848 [Hevea brasiliensis]|uniref:Protein kinase domain-containing protein n=1 Tax=Hevea brasiliensis TaxID=3981 RepID=A0A6A6LNM6_HEVBR|nr:hypothetical protein GH714_032848 [Hevea brasiliensis]
MPQGSSSFAFVNALEVFLAPEDFIPNDAPHISRAGRSSNNSYEGIRSEALQTIHRINVGGSNLTPDNDTLWRYWVPDDSYLYNPVTAKNSTFHPDRPNYLGGINEYIAPDLVYQTAKEMNIDGNRTSNTFNVSWSFNVSKNARHFVRVHFCDIISQSLGVLRFNLFIFSNYSILIDPYDKTGQLAAPFYIDFVVDSDDSGLIVGESGSVSRKHEPNKTPIFIVVGSVIGGIGLSCILAVVICLCLRCRKPKTVENWEWSPRPVRRGGSSHNRMPEGSVIGSRVPDLNLGLKISFAEIQFATNNFDVKMIVGKGGFGLVFRGTLRNGMKVAVKRSEPGSGQGLSEFQTEIMVLSKIRHRHLVSLIGYCDEMSEMILVYEFMEKGALRDHLPAINTLLPREQVNLAEWGIICKNKGTLEQIVDPSIKSQINLSSLRKFAEIAEKCLQECSADRPPMGDVQWYLEYALQLQQTGIEREPHEDSATDASAMLALPNIQRFASFSMSAEKDDMPILRDDSANIWASEVFSQLRIDDAR